MPVPEGTRYRFKTTPSGKKIRLAFAPGGKVVEAKPYSKVMSENKKKRSK